MNSKQQYLELYTFIRNVSNNISIQYDVIKKKRTSTTPSCSGPLPTHRIQRHLVPGAVYSSSLHLCSFKECHIYVRPQPSTIFKVKSNNCKRIHTSALINGSCRMISVYRSTAINFSCLKKDFRLYDRQIENDVTI